ncbi:MAG: Trehalose/maltose import ATP-binding protein MalK [Candidatus Methanofastidiosum methylothiophilum]|uniref:Trehalose/maltose import ATP-binding protein MalK n=1 Tax=Candidatus Methanofastidiosum methylothiophilum TaxID=1705564 RepID=A0A150J0G1_9EURY|nr:MAG: Trehalose/maltose import ATP-binding protein MalK [Candidatus Methanofastidiosum methylthiophilus]KYC48017.1 MAG: Trehalose/maltose import ATP-binding protein MalK [Candidatus Methanofastidiosum methylthiophilus]KYC50707.1 MAG: Trehalose/maltose import ATP-binding protein MalK [Candidatus Methanofastidiosum methylthiophilus]
MSIIEIDNLTRKFGDKSAVENISFEVFEGEIFGFLGPNGAGKTTTISILCTLLQPTSGVARISGYDVTKERDNVRNSIGIVFQDPSLDGDLTGEENLRFHGMVYNIPKPVREERIKYLLEMVDLKDKKDELTKNYSGGMKRRLEIARGLLHHPKVLFLDEPTIGLDPQTRNRIWEHIKELQEKKGITIFLTTHYMEEAENCNRIAIIDHGKIIALDTPENLKKDLKGDLITLKTSDNLGAKEVLQTCFSLNPKIKNDSIYLYAENGENFVPKVFRALRNFEITSVNVRKPTLNDVFLKLTGREIREETIDGVGRMKEMNRGR